MQEKYNIGGQAIFEGVMMKGRHLVATAVRKSDGSIAVNTRRVSSISDRYPILKLPFIRGVSSLFETMSLGIKELTHSEQIFDDGDEKLTDVELTVTIMLAVIFFILLFIFIPTMLTNIFLRYTSDLFLFNLLEGMIRLGIFLTYLFAISRKNDMHRILKYHGAEHKTINCYESDEPLTVENVRKCSRIHARCGTNFLMITMLVSIFVFSFLDPRPYWLRNIFQILSLPIIVSISYEILRFAGRSKNFLVHIAILPGLWLQHLTTLPPDDEMIEVAIKALEAVKDK